MKTLIIILSLLFSTCLVYGQEEAKPEEANPDYSTTIANAVKAGGGTLTPAIVNALMKEASADGVEGEIAMVEALMKKFPKQSAMIAKAALSTCSKDAVVGISQIVVKYCPQTSWHDLYLIAIKTNPDQPEKLQLIYLIKTEAGTIVGSESSGGIKGYITGQQNNKDEDPSSP